MSDLGDRRRKARTEAAERTSQRHEAKLLALQEAFSRISDQEGNETFDMLSLFDPAPQLKGWN